MQKEADGSTVSFQYDLLVAADGRHSKCRRLYQKFDPSFSCYLRPAPKHYVGFAGITLPGGVHPWQADLTKASLWGTNMPLQASLSVPFPPRLCS